MRYSCRFLLGFSALFLMLLGVFCSREVPEEKRVAWLKRAAMPLRSIDPKDDDFSDLAPFKKMIGRSRMVMLGEPSHGDGACFEAKTRLIKFLHQMCGFDVIAFESGLYDCHKAWQQVPDSVSGAQAVKNSVFGIWTHSRECQPLIQYIGRMAETDHPLELAGFDCQLTGRMSTDYFINDILALLRKASVDTLSLPRWRDFRQMTERLIHQGYFKEVPQANSEARFFHCLDQIRNTLPSMDGEHTGFWQQVLHNLQVLAQGSIHKARVGVENIVLKDRQFRDLAMGENLIWLAQRQYPGRKMIVWAASRHNAYRLGQVDDGQVFDADYINMGDVVRKALSRGVYNLAFTAFEGEAGAWFNEPFTLPEPSAGSLEALFHQAGFDNAILDFRRRGRAGRWLDSAVTARPFGYSEMEAVWSRIFDGICYTREMTPSTRR